MTTAIIADIVGSRRLSDRRAAQAMIDDAIARVERDLPLALRPLTATVGDELQGEYRSLDDALASTLLLRLALPEGVECRFGVGIGPTTTVPSAGGDLQDGPGWWAARAAVEALDGLERRRAPRARTWVVAAPEQDEGMRTDLANAYLLARDQLVGVMSERARRLTYGRCLGLTQQQLAEREGVTQSAVSQVLTTSGAAAVVEGFRSLRARPDAGARRDDTGARRDDTGVHQDDAGARA